MRRKKTLLVGLLCGLVCAACVFMYTQSVREEADSARAEALAKYGGDQLEVCVASRDIAAGEVVGASDVELRMWLADLLPADAVRNVSEVVGRQASSSILAGEVVSSQRFQSVGSAIEVPSGMCAVSVPAKEVQAVGGAIAPGSLVDVYATGSTSTEVLAQGVQVLATGQALQDNTSSSSSGAASWVTLAVLPSQVQEMVAAAAKSELYFTLPGSGARGASSPDEVDTSRLSGSASSGDAAASESGTGGSGSAASESGTGGSGSAASESGEDN